MRVWDVCDSAVEVTMSEYYPQEIKKSINNTQDIQGSAIIGLPDGIRTTLERERERQQTHSVLRRSGFQCSLTHLFNCECLQLTIICVPTGLL